MLFCDRIELENGEKLPFPAVIGVEPVCLDSSSSLARDFCCKRRLIKKNPELQDVCGHEKLEISGRQLGNKTKEALDKVSDILTSLEGGTSGAAGAAGAAGVGLSALACNAAEQYHQIALIFLAMALKPLPATIAALIIEWGKTFIEGFFSDIAKGTGSLTVQMNEWLETTDEAFAVVGCILDENGVHYGAIWRAVTQHSQLHRSVNVLLSLKAVADRNIIQKLFDLLGGVIFGIRKAQLEYIGNVGAAILGWAQTQRLCYTHWDRQSLQNNDQPPEDDDEEDWYPRYWIRTIPGTVTATLKSIEALTDGGAGYEIATLQWNANLPPSYVTDIHPLQAQLAKAIPGVATVERCSDTDDVMAEQEGPNVPGPDKISMEPPSSGPSTAEVAARQIPTTTTSDSGPAGTVDDPEFYPTYNAQRVAEANLRVISAVKGQNLDPTTKTFSYFYHDSMGRDSWIFVLDSGFGYKNWQDTVRIAILLSFEWRWLMKAIV